MEKPRKTNVHVGSEERRGELFSLGIESGTRRLPPGPTIRKSAHPKTVSLGPGTREPPGKNLRTKNQTTTGFSDVCRTVKEAKGPRQESSGEQKKPRVMRGERDGKDRLKTPGHGYK